MLPPKKKIKNAGDILPTLRKTYQIFPSTDSGNPSCCRFCNLAQLGTLHIVKISSRRQNNNCTPPPRLCLCIRSLSHLSGREMNQNYVYCGGLASSDWII